MEAPTRKPFQGIVNIFRFNWHFYLAAALSIAVLTFFSYASSSWFSIYLIIAIALIIIPTLISLAVSYYVYDYTDLYQFKWMSQLSIPAGASLVNLHAGFDETSNIIAGRFPGAALTVLDFYDPKKHTEPSIKRARKAYPPFPGTIAFETPFLPLADKTQDCIFVIFSAHEIRDIAERVQLFTNLHRKLKPGGSIIVVEHLRNLPNFLAYTIGFLHFYSENTWKNNFQSAGLQLTTVVKINPFVSAFILT